MPEQLRALVIVLLIALAVYRLAQPLQAQQLPGTPVLRRNLWFALLVAAFVPGNFWIFCLLGSGLLLWARRREPNPPALFLALLFVAPPSQLDVPGLGMVNYLFSLNLPRLLSLLLLLPAFLTQVQKPRRVQQGALPRAADLLFLGYALLQLALLAREPSVTSALRGVFYLFVDMVLPYFVFSRFFDEFDKIRDVMAAFVVAGLLLAGIGFFEFSRHWLLYSAATEAWGSADKLTYLGRAGVLRAMGSTGHSLALGYVLAVCLLLYLPLREGGGGGWKPVALLALMCAGLFAPLSRGPWMGAAAGVVLYLALGPRPIRNLLVLAVAGTGVLTIFALLPSGRFVLEMIPFFGDFERGNVVYRQRLLENAAQLIAKDPLFGSTDYIERLAAMGMVQGQGIVDVVNSYLQVALRSGVVGLLLFGGFMAAAFLAALRARSLSRRARLPGPMDLGRSLAAAQLAVIVIIGGASSVVVIPWVYWCLAGMLVGYARLVHAVTSDAHDGLRPLPIPTSGRAAAG